MAVGDIVRTIRDIRTFDPKTIKIRPDGIPNSSLGTIVIQDDPNKFIAVEFEFIREGFKEITTILGVFGEGTVDTINNSLEFITVQPAPDLLESIKQESVIALESTEDLALQPKEPTPFERALSALRDLGRVPFPEKLGALEQQANFAVANGLDPTNNVARFGRLPFPPGISQAVGEASNIFTLAAGFDLPVGWEFFTPEFGTRSTTLVIQTSILFTGRQTVSFAPGDEPR